jgi:hypothetical protein
MKLITFGDSWTAGHGVEEDSKYQRIAGGNDYVVDNWRSQNSWPRWVADKLNIEYINMGQCGIGNHHILQNQIKDIFKGNYLKDDDVIIVMFSYPYRNATNPIEDFLKYEEILKNYKHFYFNSFYPMFKDEENINLDLTNFIEPENTMLDMLLEYQKETGINPWNYNINITTFDDNRLRLGEYHPNINGYRKIANVIYEKIKNKL